MTTITVNTDLRAPFQLLGFSEKEIAAYLSLAEIGKGTAQLVAKRSGLPRTTAYFVLHNLAERGIVVEEQKKRTTYFSALKPAALIDLVRQKQELLAKQFDAAKLLEAALRPYFQSKMYSVPTLQFVEGKANVEAMLYSNLPDWMQSMTEQDQTWWGYQDHRFVSEYRAFLDYYWTQKPAQQKVLLFSNESDLEQQLRIPNRIIRPIPSTYQLSSTIWVCGEYLVVVMHSNRPQYAFQLRDKVLAGNLAVIFRLLWHSVEGGPPDK